ncbi:MAG: alcohol dehydrogenase catalytic domain-containing protein [Clostridiales Family XIII bacterium]|jgi:L-iditol 2-dehydrogenase|nr:alcohol dehydrogenase catalytic domain-containing protein [Clostridiales Family XIII bacterium]
MKAAVYLGKDHIEVRDVPDPVPEDGDIVVKIHACAVCGSDIRIFHHGNPRVRPPQIIGHESAGEVVAVGNGVTKFRIGDRVAIGADVPCGECEFCEAGIGNNCQINYALGYQFPGSFAQYVLLNKLTVDLGPIHKIDPSMPYDEAALAEPLACVLNATELAGIKLGDTVVIIGAGPIGLMIMPIARMLGAIKVVVVQRSKNRLEAAKALGADVVIASSEEDAIERVKEETHGLGADVIFTANSSPETHRDAMLMAKNRARISLFGGLPAGSTIELETNIIHYKELTMMGAHGAMPRHHRQAVELIAARRPDMRPYISDRFALDDIRAAFELTESHSAMRVVVHPWGTDV